MFWIVMSIIPIMMAIAMVFVRLKSASQPTSVKKIILPPLFMSTGLAMFLFPDIYVTWLQVVESIGMGAIVSIFLIKASHFKVENQEIYLVLSKSFALILMSLFLIRLFLKWLIGSQVSIGETSGMFYLLALAMIWSWRIAMLIEYRRIVHNMQKFHKIEK